VKFIVDANIVFSGILNAQGKIGDLLINSRPHFTFIAPYFLRNEISSHHAKLIRISHLTLEQIQEAEFHICKDIIFISEEQIKTSHWIAAETLVRNIDPKDTPYIAYAKHFRCKIWSGDKALMRGLEKKSFAHFITTEDIYHLREQKNKKI